MIADTLPETIAPTLAHGRVASPAADPGEYLTFRLGAEEYGIGILQVQEIRGYEVPTRLAGAPASVRGVLNLRGIVVPVADLRANLGTEPVFDASTVTMVLNVAGRTVGAVVDSVSDVIKLDADQIRPAPEFNGRAGVAHVTGIGCIQQGARERVLVLLDVEHLMADADIGLIPGANTP